MKKTLLSAILILSGCATNSGIVPTGPDSYMISKQAGSGFAGLGTMKADSIREGSEYCSKNGKIFQLDSTQEQPGGIGVFPHADVFFLCLNPGDPQLHRTNFIPTPASVVEIRNQ